MNVVLSVSGRELRGGGGDATFVKNLLRLPEDGVRYFLPQGVMTSLGRNFARLSGRFSTSRRLPMAVRGRLNFLSFFTYLPWFPTADVIHAHGFLPLGPSSHLPLVWVTAGSNRAHEAYHEESPQVYLPFWRAALRRAQVVICWSYSGAQRISELCGIGTECIRVIPPFVAWPLRSERGPQGVSDRGTLRLIYVGADARRKGLDVAMRAYQKIAVRHPQSEFHIVGPKVQKPAWTHPRVRFWGPCDYDATSFLIAHSHILVLPSYAETFGLAILEGMAAGLAVLTTRIEPLTEIVEDGVDGVLATVGDADDLAAKMESLIVNHPMRHRIQRAAVEKWERNYSQAAVMPKLLEAYREAQQRFRGDVSVR